MGGSIVSQEIGRYAAAFVVESPALRALREETAKLPMSMMQLGPEPAALLQWLVRLVGARRTLEVGTFTGYSALAVAQALPEDGRVIACDVSEEWTSVARRHWAEAGVAGKIDLRLAPAVQTLDALVAAGESGRFDLAFIDADKPSYDAYYERCLGLLRKDGILAFDNVLWSGRVAQAGEKDANTAALDAINHKASRDPRVDACLLTVGDGLLVLRKR